MVSVSTVKERLSIILGNISGVEKVVKGSPQGLSTFPCFIIITEDMTNESNTSETVIEIRNYNLWLLVQGFALGEQLEAEGKCEPFFRLVADTFYERPKLQIGSDDPLQGVISTRFLGDSGFSTITLGRAEYAGVLFRLEVKTYHYFEAGI